MKRFLEVVFRHPIRYSLPIVVALLAAVAYGSKLPSSYVTTTTIFCDSSLPNTSTLQVPVQGGGTTPAEDKQATLQEFLATQSFANKVAILATNSPNISGLAADGIAKTITVTVAGPNILRISVKATTPSLAVATAGAVVSGFTTDLQTLLQQRSQELVNAYKSVDNTSSTNLADAQAALNAYVQAHGVSTTDPTEVQLTNSVSLSEQANAAAEDNYNQALLGQATGLDPSAFHQIDPPIAPTAPASQKKRLLLVGAGGILGGLVVSILLIVLVLAMDRTVRVEDELATAVEVIASVPQFAAGILTPKRRRRRPDNAQAKRLAAERDAQAQAKKTKKVKKGVAVEGDTPLEPAPQLPTGPPNGSRPPPVLVESCRGALHHLTLGERRVGTIADRRSSVRGVREASTSIGLTSCLRGEGRSTVAAGLAAAIHQAHGSVVILLELDLAQPSLARQFGIESGPGVAEILRDGRSIEECLYMPDDGTAGLLVAGDAKGDPDGLFVTLRSGSFMQDLGRLCEVVVADLPPILANGHAVELAELFGSVLLVVRSGTLPLREIRHAVDDLETPPPAILNGVESSVPRRLRALFGG